MGLLSESERTMGNFFFQFHLVVVTVSYLFRGCSSANRLGRILPRSSLPPLQLLSSISVVPVGTMHECSG